MTGIVCYTAIFGAIRDTLHEPVIQDEQVAYQAFTDEAVDGMRACGWDLRAPKWLLPDKRRQARMHKVLSHVLYPDAEFTLWLDGCLTPLFQSGELIDTYLNDCDVATFRHMERSCLYQELEACRRLRKDVDRAMRVQVDRYRAEGYPYNNGLGETTAVLRRNNEKMRDFNEAWWREIEQGSSRDQLSFDYVAWKLGIKYAHLDGSRTRSRHFQWRAHR